jgi:hypothetical protein
VKGNVRMGNVQVDVLDVFYKALPSTIYGGSNDVQRNVIAKRVLNLPGESSSRGTSSTSSERRQ